MIDLSKDGRNPDEYNFGFQQMIGVNGEALQLGYAIINAGWYSQMDGTILSRAAEIILLEHQWKDRLSVRDLTLVYRHGDIHIECPLDEVAQGDVGHDAS